ncbi:DNA polymerase delta small subunit Cdc1 [Coemansia sp. RSA 2599]|nr:DNA polymerase delta small subunit Cdc1 [Coemansia sp. RSA 2599]
MSIDAANSNALLERASVTVTDDIKGVFRTGKRTYEQQFDELYSQRLRELKPAAAEAAEQRWPKVHATQSVLNVEGPEATFIIGTVFIDSASKPSTLQQVEVERWVSDKHGEKYRETADAVVFLEDESGRIRLVGPVVEKTVLASGIVAAVLGVETAEGDFEVADICFAPMAPQQPRPALDEDKYVALVSGLGMTAERPMTLALQLLAETLCGGLGGGSSMQPLAARIAQVVLAGDTMQLSEAPLGHAEDARANDRTAAAKLAAQVDVFLADIAANVPVAIMPGAGDPADSSLPQQPLPRSLLAQCSRYSGFSSLTNPALLQLDGVHLLGTSGQNVDDLRRYSSESPGRLAAASLGWRHIAPTAPDTLWCYPFTTHDPFVLHATPHVYFVGNQSQFDSVVTRGPDGQTTRVVMVPRFSDTSQIVLVNLRTLECSTLEISA